ncbi:MAG: MarR family transcriptional regulator [Bradyrhizobium sp.]|nr:MarR family transcriptional regulator [Bradyrhizobium sp.]
MAVSNPSDPLSEDFRLADWPFYHMNRAIRSYDTEMRRLLRSSGLDVARWRILMIAHEKAPVSVGEVVSQAIMEPSTVTRAMQRLQKEGLLTITTRASDQRVSEAVLTEQGRAIMQRVLKAASRVFHQAFASFQGDEIRALNAQLARVHRALEEPL